MSEGRRLLIDLDTAIDSGQAGSSVDITLSDGKTGRKSGGSGKPEETADKPAPEAAKDAETGGFGKHLPPSPPTASQRSA